MDMETFPTSNVAVQTMICSLLLQTAQKSLLSLLLMIEFLRLYPDLVVVERRYPKIMFFSFLFIFLFVCEFECSLDPRSYYRFPFGELKEGTVPDNEPKDSSETDDENEDTDNDEDDDAEDEEVSDDDDEDSDGDDADANEGSDDDSDEEEDDDDDSDDEDEDDEDDEDDEEEDNQPPYTKMK
ncbi:acidic leucine-rich nuclear phosphoprotein 32 family member B-like isoform X1 [Solanum pennellii]|uniref:Acidic leucine-rich nuclear phosphoprotein 32 family member B-like isoform X1 n=1 Tax=Solanum pennellii TaxID=28526 RepID=A0ABM1VBR4_SOLPN|nr:acidic leucine-rich nuclear phosphoprotein 32 family member B-like isoform X1 [Solanum pennellii]